MNLIYDIQEIKNLLMDLHNVTGFRVGLFDSEFCEIMAYPSRISDICLILRSNDEMMGRCRACDLAYFSNCKKTGEVVIYECHAGFTEMIIPIHAASMNIAYIMCGQISKYDQFDAFYEYVKMLNYDFDELKRSFHHVHKNSQERINSAANIVKLSVENLYQSEKIRLLEDSLPYQIDSYILENITEKLDVDQLCAQFNYRKTKFYDVTQQMYGVGIMKHIRQLRVQLAKKLLATTNFPISKVAMEVGIPDYNYFTKVFKEEAFCTPREYRKNNIARQSDINPKKD